MFNPREGRYPVSTIKTGCVPFNHQLKGASGFNVGPNPVKKNGKYFPSFDTALAFLRTTDIAGWRELGAGNNSGARKAIGWVTKADADKLLKERDVLKRIELFKSLTDVVS
jgi:hypothetical protein